MRVCFKGAAPSGWTMKRPVMRRCTARIDGTGRAAATAGGSRSSRASLPRRRAALMRVPASRSTGRLRGCRERSRSTSTRSMQHSSTCGRRVRTTVSTSGNSGMIHLIRKDLPRAGPKQQGPEPSGQEKDSPCCGQHGQQKRQAKNREQDSRMDGPKCPPQSGGKTDSTG